MSKIRGNLNHGTEVHKVLLNVVVATVGKNICLHVCCEVIKIMLHNMSKNRGNLNHGTKVHKVILNVVVVNVYTYRKEHNGFN